MPYAACNQCARYYILSHESSPDRTCPHCLQPLRSAMRDEALDHLRKGRESTPSPQGEPVTVTAEEVRWLRAQKAMNEAEQQRSVAARARQQARELRRQKQETRPQPPEGEAHSPKL